MFADENIDKSETLETGASDNRPLSPVILESQKQEDKPSEKEASQLETFELLRDRRAASLMTNEFIHLYSLELVPCFRIKYPNVKWNADDAVMVNKKAFLELLYSKSRITFSKDPW